MIRELTERELDEFLKVRTDSLKLNPNSFGSDPNLKIDKEKTRVDLKSKNEENFILGYYNHDQMIGLVGFIRESGIKKKHKGFIWGVFVYPEFRGKGIGKELLKACLTKIAELNGIVKVVLTVTHTSTEAIALYKRLGFNQFGIEKNSMKWKGVSIDEIYMEKIMEEKPAHNIS